MSAFSCVPNFQIAKLSGYLSVLTFPDLAPAFDTTDQSFLHDTYSVLGS